MSRQHSARVLLAWSTLVVGCAALFFLRLQPQSDIVISKLPSLLDNRPIGEIVPGFHVEQQLKAKFEGLPSGRGNEQVCIDILLANYSNRSNSGQFEIGLILDGDEHIQKIDAAGVADNAIRRVCLTDVSVSTLLSSRKVRIVLRGVSSPTGAAVTAWSTADTSVGHILMNGSTHSPRSLVVGLSSRFGKEKGKHNELILIVFGALAIATIFWAIPKREQPSRLDGPQG